jgi:hypothetical protein
VKKNYIYKFITFLLVFTICILFIEFFLRLSGIKPWTDNANNGRSINLYDATIGWKAKKGKHEMPTNKITRVKTIININDRGDRLSSKNEISNNQGDILFFGGSFTQGWGLNDLETYPAKFQERYSNYKIFNFGQAGYGSTQSLLLLEEEIKNIKSPKLIIYGFMDHHFERNVARGEWLGVLLKYRSDGFGQKPKVPYATIDNNGELEIHKPLGYITLPLRKVSSTITTVEKIYMKQTTRHRKKIQEEVLNKIVLKMKNISELSGASFIVVNLSSNTQSSDSNLKKFFTKEKINYVDCRILLKDKYLIPGEHHPTELAHAYYNDCLIKYIAEEKILLF